MRIAQFEPAIGMQVFGHERLERLQHAIGIHAFDEAEGELGGGLRRNDRL